MDERVSRAKMTERMLTRSGGATMRDIIAATGGPQYNELKRLAARGYSIRKVKEGNETRYFVTAPAAPAFEVTMTSKGQVTIPKAVRDRLRVGPSGKLRFAIEDGDRVVMSARPSSIQDLFGILGKPPRSATIEEMDEGIRRAVADKYLRAIGRKR
jgi:antitoxin PrlF